MDYLAITYPECVVDDEEDETAKWYESVLELIQEKVKPDFVDTFIAIASKRTTPKQIASKMVNAKELSDDEYEKLVIKEANKISKKYNRALEKIKKFL